MENIIIIKTDGKKIQVITPMPENETINFESRKENLRKHIEEKYDGLLDTFKGCEIDDNDLIEAVIYLADDLGKNAIELIDELVDMMENLGVPAVRVASIALVTALHNHRNQ